MIVMISAVYENSSHTSSFAQPKAIGQGGIKILKVMGCYLQASLHLAYLKNLETGCLLALANSFR
jgi:hypothetical protein